MKKAVIWILAFIITLATAYYQRKTGPTYPVSGKVILAGSEIKFELARSHGGEEDHRVSIKIDNPEIGGYLLFKRYKTADEWTNIPLKREEDFLVAALPHQPPAGKLMYLVFLTYGNEKVSLTGEKPVIIRFKGKVPLSVLVLHVIVMFLAMLISSRAGIEAFNPEGKHRIYAIWVLVLLFVGGFILGPLVQKYAFGAWWTGFPFGFDLTDNKTLIAFIGWMIALIAAGKKKPRRWWYLGAALLLLIVYLIPHSLLGSELDYSKLQASPR